MTGDEFEVGMRVRIGTGRNVWRVDSIGVANGRGELPAGMVARIGLVAVERPDHGTNGGSPRGSFRAVYLADFDRVTRA